MPDASPPEHDATAEALADAPVVVRVEIAALTLSARALAALRRGDVLSTGVRLGEPVSLRSSGVELARAELCELEGEIAVRIVETKGT